MLIKFLFDKFELTIIKSIGINDKNDLKKIEKIKLADYYLFDYKPKINEPKRILHSHSFEQILRNETKDITPVTPAIARD